MGTSANEPALLPLGIVLSQPPLRGPVLTQHALGYLFRPAQERATYFKAVLEVTDLEVFRGVVAALEADVKAPDDPALTRLNAAAAVPDAAPLLGPLGYPRAPVGGTDRVVPATSLFLGACRPSLRQPVQGARGASLDRVLPAIGPSSSTRTRQRHRLRVLAKVIGRPGPPGVALLRKSSADALPPRARSSHARKDKAQRQVLTRGIAQEACVDMTPF